jgi:hypothetical protein
MMELQFRALKPKEIDVRISQVKEKGLSLLLYKDARCDMNILDETVGPYNWKREHTRDNANCIVSIWDPEKGQWISKEDTGTESFTEKEKGIASDSFKRACFNWGIGRELYTAPFIWVTNAAIYSTTVNGKTIYKCNDKFEVQDIEYDENKNIVGIIIKNLTNKKQAFPTIYNQSDDHINEPQPSKPKDDKPKDDKTKVYKCKDCTKEVPENVAKFSYKKFKKILCMDCQKKHQ